MSGSSSGSVRFRDSSWPFGLRLLAVPPPVPPGSAELHLCEARLSWWHGVVTQHAHLCEAMLSWWQGVLIQHVHLCEAMLSWWCWVVIRHIHLCEARLSWWHGVVAQHIHLCEAMLPWRLGSYLNTNTYARLCYRGGRGGRSPGKG